MLRTPKKGRKSTKILIINLKEVYFKPHKKEGKQNYTRRIEAQKEAYFENSNKKGDATGEYKRRNRAQSCHFYLEPRGLNIPHRWMKTQKVVGMKTTYGKLN